MKKSPIIIVGFGRSGTTWLSDIISKTLGGIILFEPFHPKVYHNAESYCYSNSSNRQNVLSQIDECQEYSPKTRWLYRNHINQSEDTISSFVKYVSEHTHVIGFKTIRSNHMTPFLSTTFGGKIILIHRHPLAVLSSIINRPQFWNEFGWTWHSENFFLRSLSEEHFTKEQIRALRQIKSSCSAKFELIILMWSISFMISIKDIHKVKGYILSYEKLYLDPFSEVKKLLEFLGKESSKIHPSHIFTPSLTTLKTIHEFDEINRSSRGKLDDIFWKSNLSQSHQKALISLVKSALELDSTAYQKGLNSGYIRV